MRRMFLIIVASLTVAGCGDGEKEQIRATLDADGEAWKRQDWAAACALRTEAGRRGLCPDEPDADTVAGSEAIITFVTTDAGPPEIDVDGDRATVRYKSGSTTRLRKVDGRWLIDSTW